MNFVRFDLTQPRVPFQGGNHWRYCTKSHRNTIGKLVTALFIFLLVKRPVPCCNKNPSTLLLSKGLKYNPPNSKRSWHDPFLFHCFFSERCSIWKQYSNFRNRVPWDEREKGGEKYRVAKTWKRISKSFIFHELKKLLFNF